MNRRSIISLGAILKNAFRLMPYPWITAKLVRFQAEKYLFDMFNLGDNNGRARKIHQLSIRITDACNLRCHTCGQWGEKGYLRGARVGELRNREVPADRYIGLFQDLVENGHRPNVYFWGGEPLLYPGLLELVRQATALRLPTSIASNGYRLDMRAEDFVRAGLFLMQLSIDGHSKALHNRIRPSAGAGDSYSHVVSALEAFRAVRKKHGKKLPLLVSLTVISKFNMNHLVDIYETFRDKIDMFVFYLSWWISPERARLHCAEFNKRFGGEPRLHWGWVGSWLPADYALIDEQLKQVRQRSAAMGAPPVTVIPNLAGIDTLRAYYNNHGERFGFNQCISIFQAAEINSSGDMSPCRDYHDYVVGNIKTNTITQLWNSRAYRLFRRSLQEDGLMPVCSRCCGLMGY